MASTPKIEPWQKTVDIRFDWPRADVVFRRLLQALHEKQYPYDHLEKELPQVPANLPPILGVGTREHALFLFALCLYMRGGIQSNTAAVSLGFLYEKHPEVFLPEVAATQQPAYITSLLRKFGLGTLSENNGQYWVDNAQRLLSRWEGDPAVLLRNVHTYEEACARIKNDHKGNGFFGFQEKMVSMLIYFLVDAGFVDPFLFPPPVDIQILRQLISHEIVTLTNGPKNANLYFPRLLEKVRDFFMQYCTVMRVKPLELADALWIYGRALCSLHPGNGTLQEGPREGRKTKLRDMPLRWDQSQIRAWQRSCGSCLVASTCTLEIPSKRYYVSGEIIVRGSRRTPPDGLVMPLLASANTSLLEQRVGAHPETESRRRSLQREGRKQKLLKQHANGHHSSGTQGLLLGEVVEAS